MHTTQTGGATGTRCKPMSRILNYRHGTPRLHPMHTRHRTEALPNLWNIHNLNLGNDIKSSLLKKYYWSRKKKKKNHYIQPALLNPSSQSFFLSWRPAATNLINYHSTCTIFQWQNKNFKLRENRSKTVTK